MTTAFDGGVSAFRRIQVGREAANAAGTPVAATHYLYGQLQLTPMQDFYLPEEERNSLAEIHRATITSKQSDMRFEGSLQFETIHHLLAMGLQRTTSAAGIAIGTLPSSPAGGTKTRLYTFAPSMTTRNFRDTYTVEYGDNQQGYFAPFVVCRNLEFVFEMNNAVMITADLVGKLTDKRNFTPGIAQQLVHDAVSQNTDVYIRDDVDSANTWGDVTAADKKDNLVNALTISIPTGTEVTRYMNSQLDFNSYSEMRRSFDLDFTLRHNAAGVVEYDKYAAVDDRERFYTVRTNGPKIEDNTTPANPSFYHYAEFRFGCIYIESPQFFEDLDGDNGFTIKAKSIHDPTWNRDVEILVQTQEGF